MPFLVVKKRTIIFVAIIILCSILLAIPFNGACAAEVFFNQKTKLCPVYSVDTDKKQVAISFDAAWGADKTQDIMNICKEYGVNATFFLVGFWADKYTDLVKKISDEGFEIGTHSNTHPDFATLSKTQMEQELVSSIDKIKTITNKNVELFRMPYGSYNDTAINLCSELNLIPIQWDVDSLDWKGLSAQEICNRILNGVKSGSIILCHNNADNIVAALPLVLDRLQKQGYTITSVGELIYKENYTIDRNGIQHQNIS